MDLQLAGEAALCTAATGGLGLASAEALAREGADVAVCGRGADGVDTARSRLADLGSGDVLAVQADVTDPDEVAALVAETRETFGGIDHLVTSAGGPPSGGFTDTTPGDWYDAYDGLVMSAVWTLQAALDPLRDGDGGTWTAITSFTVREVADDLVLSNAVRRAVIGLVKTCSRELAPALRANAVLPGPHETTRISDLIDAAVERGDVPDYETGYREWAADVPVDRIGEPAELGDVVAFLASDRASFVNGAALAVDGGSMRSV